MTLSRTATIVTISIIALFSIVEAGDACCKAEAARRALIANPFALKPENWDDEDDGPWEAPKIAMADLPGWYRLLHETRSGLIGAAPSLISGVIAASLLITIMKPLFPSSVLRALLLGKRGEKYNRGNAMLDSIRGSMFGLLVPFCSCGALPLAIALKQERISSSSVAAFVTAAQAAGIDSMVFTYGIFGARVAILRLLAAGILASLVGMSLAPEKSDVEEDTSKKLKPVDSEKKEQCCGNGTPLKNDCDEGSTMKTSMNVSALLTIFAKTSVQLFSSVAVWVFLGVLVSSLANIWVPPTSTAASAHNSFVTFFSADVSVISLIKSVASRAGLFILSLPLTICEHGIVSLADTLHDVGFSAGTSMALIVTGPSTNAGTLLLLSRMNSNCSISSNCVFDVVKIVSVVVTYGITLSYLADAFGGYMLMERSEPAEAGGFGSLFSSWLEQNAVTLAGLFTIASILQSSMLFRSSSPHSSPHSSSSSCSS